MESLEFKHEPGQENSQKKMKSLKISRNFIDSEMKSPRRIFNKDVSYWKIWQIIFKRICEKKITVLDMIDEMCQVQDEDELLNFYFQLDIELDT